MKNRTHLGSVAYALSDETRLRLIKILNSHEMTSMQVFSEYQRKYGGALRRESIYRSLDVLVQSGIAAKKYSLNEKAILYSIISQEIRIDLRALEVVIGE